MSLIARMNLLSGLKSCRALSLPLRQISTSKKKSDTAVGALQDAAKATACETKTAEQWMSYGFSRTNKEEDRHVAHGLSFFTVTMVFVFGGFILAYRPEEMNIDWAQREAFLELRRREALGLPVIDPNYIPVDQINLPTDEELGDTEIII